LLNFTTIGNCAIEFEINSRAAKKADKEVADASRRNCPNRTDDDYEETLTKNMLDQQSDKLATFKNTFKEKNGKYYYISSEVEKN
jgi:hypothetical protein